MHCPDIRGRRQALRQAFSLKPGEAMPLLATAPAVRDVLLENRCGDALMLALEAFSTMRDDARGQGCRDCVVG